MQLTEQIGMVLLVFALMGGILWFAKRRGAGFTSLISQGPRAGRKHAPPGSIGTRSVVATACFAFGARGGTNRVDCYRTDIVHSARHSDCAGLILTAA